MGKDKGLHGSVSKEQGEKWLANLFEDKQMPAATNDNEEAPKKETKSEMKKRV